MLQTKSTLNGLLGAIILSAGFAVASPAMAEPTNTEETVDVRIKMPDGTVVVQKARRHSARVDASVLGQKTVKRLPDGSRVSIGANTGSARRTSGARSSTSHSASNQGTTVRRRSIVIESQAPVDQVQGDGGAAEGYGSMESETTQQLETVNVPTA
ncbi:MAG: hypothetical protein JKY96_04670, partial [Phycisphaerales bacterium]|nr:hypothetical protein [Phycisphaerales bacterium]